jgi:hypothetical protein
MKAKLLANEEKEVATLLSRDKIQKVDQWNQASC